MDVFDEDPFVGPLFDWATRPVVRGVRRRRAARGRAQAALWVIRGHQAGLSAHVGQSGLLTVRPGRATFASWGLTHRFDVVSTDRDCPTEGPEGPLQLGPDRAAVRLTTPTAVLGCVLSVEAAAGILARLGPPQD